MTEKEFWKQSKGFNKNPLNDGCCFVYGKLESVGLFIYIYIYIIIAMTSRRVDLKKEKEFYYNEFNPPLKYLFALSLSLSLSLSQCLSL